MKIKMYFVKSALITYFLYIFGCWFVSKVRCVCRVGWSWVGRNDVGGLTSECCETSQS